jgi:prepilin-type N-terminal cleavage/methylation domain-containing protein/prepilin-type processing-associated H-X9-DG protein
MTVTYSASNFPLSARIDRSALKSDQQGFTLIELLVVIAIIAVLAGLGHAAFSSAIGKAQMSAEIAASKTLITAYHAAAVDNGGKFLLAYDKSAKGVLGSDGKPLKMKLAAYGYAFRLAPYFNYAIDDTLLVSGNKQQIQKLGYSPGHSLFDYIVSRHPSLGINQDFVGGTTGENDPEAIRTTAQAANSIIAFVSAGGDGEAGFMPGYAYVGAPSSPHNFKFVDARHSGKAVVAFLDGSTRLMTIDELKDMRLWSMRAAQANDPNYSPGK